MEQEKTKVNYTAITEKHLTTMEDGQKTFNVVSAFAELETLTKKVAESVEQLAELMVADTTKDVCIKEETEVKN